MLDWNRLIPDFGLTAGQLAKKYQGDDGHGGHPHEGLTRRDWKQEVASEATRFGYWGWLDQKLIQLEDELQNDNPFTVDT